MALSTMTLHSQMDCSDGIWQENPDPQLLKQPTREAKPQLRSNLPRTNRTWFETASFSGFFLFCFVFVCVSLFLFLPWLLAQDKPSKANYAPQTNHIRCPASRQPTSGFPRQHPPTTAQPKPSIFSPLLSHSPPYLWVSAQCKWWWLLQEALTKEPLCLLVVVWSSFISTNSVIDEEHEC